MNVWIIYIQTIYIKFYRKLKYRSFKSVPPPHGQDILNFREMASAQIKHFMFVLWDFYLCRIFPKENEPVLGGFKAPPVRGTYSKGKNQIFFPRLGPPWPVRGALTGHGPPSRVGLSREGSRACPVRAAGLVPWGQPGL